MSPAMVPEEPGALEAKIKGIGNIAQLLKLIHDPESVYMLLDPKNAL